MSEIILKAKKREPGTKIARALREENFVPGVFYTNGDEAVHFSVKRTDLRPIVTSSEAKVVSLQVDGMQPLLGIMKAVDFHPLTDKVIHFDLLGIAAGHKIMVEIPIHLIGSAVGVVVGGGMLDQVMLRAHVMVDPTKMPEHIDVNVDELDINSSIHVGDLNADGIEFMDRPEAVIVTCAAPKVAEAKGVDEAEVAVVAPEGAKEAGKKE